MIWIDNVISDMKTARGDTAWISIVSVIIIIINNNHNNNYYNKNNNNNYNSNSNSNSNDDTNNTMGSLILIQPIRIAATAASHCIHLFLITAQSHVR